MTAHPINEQLVAEARQKAAQLLSDTAAMYTQALIMRAQIEVAIRRYRLGITSDVLPQEAIEDASIRTSVDEAHADVGVAMRARLKALQKASASSRRKK